MSSPVTIIGLGPMGQAMARTLLTAGHDVTVWNRTPARAESLLGQGARLAATPAEAIRSSDLVILSLTDYQAMYDILDGADAALAGRTIVNLSSDTPARTAAAAVWAAERGATFVAGGVMVPAPMVGTDAAYIYYSGPQQVFEQHRGTLVHLGAPRYLGEDPQAAPLMYLANLDVFLTSLSSLLHATALAQTAGLKATEVLPELMTTLAGIPAMLAAGEDTGAQIDAGDHPGDLSTTTMMGATADHIVEASAAAGIDLTLPRAVQGHYRRAVDDGHGGDNWTRLIDGIRHPEPPGESQA